MGKRFETMINFDDTVASPDTITGGLAACNEIAFKVKSNYYYAMYSITQVYDAYKKATHRILLLDYDGTLREFEPTPPQASPTEEIYNILRSLGSDTRNRVVVISGREHVNLEDWFGDLPVSLSGEHGLLVKEKGGSWKPMASLDLSWKDESRAILQKFVDRIEHTFIEEKTASLAWHYRNASDEAVQAALPELEHELAEVAKKFVLNVRHASKVVEIGSSGVSKGIAAGHFLENAAFDFILAIGDEETDEDMFKSLPTTAFTVKVRPGPSAAKFRLPDPAAARKFLSDLCS